MEGSRWTGADITQILKELTQTPSTKLYERFKLNWSWHRTKFERAHLNTCQQNCLKGSSWTGADTTQSLKELTWTVSKAMPMLRWLFFVNATDAKSDKHWLQHRLTFSIQAIIVYLRQLQAGTAGDESVHSLLVAVPLRDRPTLHHKVIVGQLIGEVHYLPLFHEVLLLVPQPSHNALEQPVHRWMVLQVQMWC